MFELIFKSMKRIIIVAITPEERGICHVLFRGRLLFFIHHKFKDDLVKTAHLGAMQRFFSFRRLFKKNE